MTRRDVFIQIMHEVSGKPKDFIKEIFDASLLLAPNSGQRKADEEISIEEYEQLLNELRKEKEGIRRWLIKGELDFVLHYGKPQGNA